MKEWGGEEGHPDRTTTCAELVVRGDSSERRRGVSEEVKGDLGRTRDREGGENRLLVYGEGKPREHSTG